MRVIFTNRFRKDYKKLSANIRKRTDEKFKLLLQNPSHPSLRVKKVKKCKNIFECSVSENYRFLFEFNKGICVLHRVGTHDILDKL